MAEVCIDSPGAITGASFTRFDRARQLLPAPLLHDDVFPTFIEDLFDPSGDVDDLAGRDHFVVTMDIAIKHLIIPEAVFGLPILLGIRHLIPMQYLALPP